MSTFRPLLIFWACILGLLAGTAVTLQFIGAPPLRAVTSIKVPLQALQQQQQPARALPSALSIPPGAWPPGIVERDFSGCTYLELGWGDRKFYPARHPTALMALGAALDPGPSVLHIAGFNPPLADAHPWSALVAVPCTREELARLCRDLGRSFETAAGGKVVHLGPGLYGRRSGFYPARGRYWVGNNCNTWTARELRAGGLPAHTDIFEALTSGEVVAQARRLVREREVAPGRATAVKR